MILRIDDYDDDDDDEGGSESSSGHSDGCRGGDGWCLMSLLHASVIQLP